MTNMSPNEANLKPGILSGVTLDELASVARLRLALRRFQVASDEAMKRHRLTPRQYDILGLLLDPTRTDRSTSALAGSLLLSANSTSELISRAVAAGLVTRKTDPHDARLKPLNATSLGRRRYLAAVADLRAGRGELSAILHTAALLAQS